jgi:hypothetical protein
LSQTIAFKVVNRNVADDSEEDSEVGHTWVTVHVDGGKFKASEDKG